MSDDSDDFDAVTQNAKNEEELAGVDQVLRVKFRLKRNSCRNNWLTSIKGYHVKFKRRVRRCRSR